MPDNILVGLMVIVIGYLLGSISFSRLVTRLVSPETDLKETLVPVEGTDAEIHMSAVSATSVRFKLGPRYGLLASFLDMAKVALPVAVFKFLFPDSPAEFLAAIGGLLGHNWPLYYKFEGGYGQSAIYGALFVLEWTAVPVSFLGTGLLYLFLRKVHLASIGGVLILIPWFRFLGYGSAALLYAGIASAAYFIRILPDFHAIRKIELQKSKLGSIDEI